MEMGERHSHFIRLNGENEKLYDMGISFGLVLIEDRDKLGSYTVRAWWRDDEWENYPSNYTDKEEIFDCISDIPKALDWIHVTLTDHITHRLEYESNVGKQAEKFLLDIEANEFVHNGLRL